MDEKLADKMGHAASALHWLGKCEESNTISLLCRLLRVQGIDDVLQFEKYVEAMYKKE